MLVMEPIVDRESLGKRLRELRVQAGLTQKEVAQKASISQGQYTYYESGKREPLASLMPVLAAAFDVSIEELFADPESEPEAPKRGRPKLADKDEG